VETGERRRAAACAGLPFERSRRLGRDDAPARRSGPHALIAALESTRPIVPGFNNWLLFSATVEAGLKSLGADWDRTRVDYAIRQHEQWYKGDGAYGDGPEFHWDYYNSFVIHPMLVDVLDACTGESPAWTAPMDLGHGVVRPAVPDRSRARKLTHASSHARLNLEP
jgi:hypothetical protein